MQFFSVEKVLYEDGSRYFCEVKMKSGKWYMYLLYDQISRDKKVNKIIFPDNCLMHISAITIEN